MKKKPVEEVAGPNWMDTYGDMVTLLLTFFILLFAMSSIDEGKYKIYMQSLTGATTTENVIVIPKPNQNEGDGPKDSTNPADPATPAAPTTPQEVVNFDDLFEYLQQYINNNKLNNSIELYKGDGYTFITFKDNIFFEPDKYQIKPDGRKILDVFSEAVKKIEPLVGQIKTYGHTAQSRGGQDNDSEFDRILSGDRASMVTSYVELKLKGLYPGDKFRSQGYGMWLPRVPHDGTEVTRQKNRRVEMMVAKSGSAYVSLEEVYESMNNPDAKKTEDKTNTVTP